MFSRSFRPILTASSLPHTSSIAHLRPPSLHRFKSSTDGRVPPANPSLDPTSLDSFSISSPPTETASIGITSVSSAGVELGPTGSTVIIPGAAIVLGGKPMLWNVGLPIEGDEMSWRKSGWTEEALRVFEIVAPRPEMLLFGTGPTVLPVPTWIRSYFSNLGIQTDVMSTASAAATYNVLAEEGRLVALAFLPSLKNIDIRTGQYASNAVRDISDPSYTRTGRDGSA